ncbi:MAG TPA: hypothetical protein VKU84_02530 [Stellaceae bacterium]|nr:hypothetical protein [Stellaceae bacterium]
MSFIDDPTLIADGLVALATLLAAAWVALKAFRESRRLPDPGRHRHALAPLAAATDPFRAGEDPAFAILRPEQVAAVQRQSGFNLAINIANAVVLVAVVGHTANAAMLALWFVTVVSIALRGLALWIRNRDRPLPAAVSKRNLRQMTYYAALLGSLWGMGFALFYGSADATGRIVLCALGMGHDRRRHRRNGGVAGCRGGLCGLRPRARHPAAADHRQSRRCHAGGALRSLRMLDGGDAHRSLRLLRAQRARPRRAA